MEGLPHLWGSSKKSPVEKLHVGIMDYAHEQHSSTTTDGHAALTFTAFFEKPNGAVKKELTVSVVQDGETGLMATITGSDAAGSSDQTQHRFQDAAHMIQWLTKDMGMVKMAHKRSMVDQFKSAVKSVVHAGEKAVGKVLPSGHKNAKKKTGGVNASCDIAKYSRTIMMTNNNLQQARR